MSGGDGHYRFSTTGLTDVQSVGQKQVDECDKIWQDVMTRIRGLFPDGQIDSDLNAVLEDRNETYRRQVTRYAEDLGLQNVAVGKTRDIAQEGGNAMRKAARL